MSDNTLRAEILHGEQYEFDQDEYKKEALSVMRDRAAERGLTIDASMVRYLGASEPRQDWAKGKGVVCHTFETEAIEPRSADNFLTALNKKLS